MPNSEIGYAEGTFLPVEQISVPLWDAGFVWGATVVDQIRTYGGKLPLLDLHLDRFLSGCEIVGIRLSVDRAKLIEIVSKVVEHNWPMAQNKSSANEDRSMPKPQEIGICLLATPGDVTHLMPTGWDSTRAPQSVVSNGDRLIVHTYGLPDRWEGAEQTGVQLVTSSVHQIDTTGFPVTVKTRSRVHFYLAMREGRQRSSEAIPLLLRPEGLVAETTTGAVVAWKDNVLTAPPAETILDSVSLKHTMNLADVLGLRTARRPMSLTELLSADEVLWTSTPCGVLPVTRIDDNAINDQQVGPVCRELRAAWDRSVR